MRDIPMFPTDYGAAGLVLNQIPYTGNAYVHVHSALDLKLLLEECAGFCIAAGAERVYDCGDCDFFGFEADVAILKMQQQLEELADTDTCLMPITEATLGEWLKIHNAAMSGVDHAAYLSSLDGKRLLADGGGYFVHRDSSLLGIGVANGDTIATLASVQKGAGRDVVLALCHALSGDTVHLEVAQTNHRAIALYRRLGFIEIGIKCQWYRIK